MIEVVALKVGQLETNCYLVAPQGGRDLIIIDPGAEPERILSEIEGLNVKYIINTHGHADHIGANRGVKEATGASILIHRDDAQMLTDPRENLSFLLDQEITSPPADRLLGGEGGVVGLDGFSLRVIHTPGHSPGGISLLGGHCIFTGDTLFARSIGRVDLPGACLGVLLESIRERLLILEDEVIIYPGHGPFSTIGEERRWNPFLK